MNSLEPPESHFLAAAQGWLELGRQTEAKSECENISMGFRNHPDVLEVLWNIHYLEQDWAACVLVGSASVEAAPDRPLAWRHRSASLHFFGETRSAYEKLLPALEEFPDEWSIRYDIACYACSLGNQNEARCQLKIAVELGDRFQNAFKFVNANAPAETVCVKQMALSDPDLQSLWHEIKRIWPP